jgi:hypothetical protein
MKQRFLVPGLILIGICLLAVGLTWRRIVPPAAYWGPEQADEYSAAQSQLHAIGHEHEHDPDFEREITLARERFEESYQELEDARSSRNLTGIIFTAAGVIVLLAGIVLHMTAGRAE